MKDFVTQLAQTVLYGYSRTRLAEWSRAFIESGW
jgi:hypothetical protein